MQSVIGPGGGGEGGYVDGECGGESDCSAGTNYYRRRQPVGAVNWPNEKRNDARRADGPADAFEPGFPEETPLCGADEAVEGWGVSPQRRILGGLILRSLLARNRGVD